jgi:transcriptional regulator with GAF, ATPase, and Fis domain
MSVPKDSRPDRLLHELGNAFAARLGLDELIPYVIARCREALDAEGVSLLLLDQERNELYFPYVSEKDSSVARRLRGIRFPATSGIAGAVLRSGGAEKVDDAQADPRFYSKVDRRTGATTKSLLAAALTTTDSRLGVIEAVNHQGGTPFSEADLALLQRLASSIAIAIHNAQRFNEVSASAQELRAQVGQLRRELTRESRFSEIIATSPAMNEVFRLMETAATSSIAVLLTGETGTGKELVARAIHRAGPRADRPFIAVNCAALPEQLLESELFGHRRGAFTGAIDDQLGLFRAAAGGTILLDEIGEMALPMQAKLLRMLQEGEVTPVGDTRPQKVDVRVISATNRDLRTAVTSRSFREDLYYRLAVFPIRIPPLRERREDIPLLATRFLAHAAERYRKHLPGFEPAVLDLLSRAPWPGNVRELQNEIERAVALASEEQTIAIERLSQTLREAEISAGSSGTESTACIETHRLPPVESLPSQNREREALSLEEACRAFEVRYISEALERYNRNVSRTATALSISRVALQKKMKKYALR